MYMYNVWWWTNLHYLYTTHSHCTQENSTLLLLYFSHLVWGMCHSCAHIIKLNTLDFVCLLYNITYWRLVMTSFEINTYIVWSNIVNIFIIVSTVLYQCFHYRINCKRGYQQYLCLLFSQITCWHSELSGLYSENVDNYLWPLHSNNNDYPVRLVVSNIVLNMNAINDVERLKVPFRNYYCRGDPDLPICLRGHQDFTIILIIKITKIAQRRPYSTYRRF